MPMTKDADDEEHSGEPSVVTLIVFVHQEGEEHPSNKPSNEDGSPRLPVAVGEIAQKAHDAST